MSSSGRHPPGRHVNGSGAGLDRGPQSQDVVQKFVEFTGPALIDLDVTDRATLANMCPEYGASLAFFPIDQKTLSYLRMTGRSDHQVELVETYARAQGMWCDAGCPEPVFSEVIEFNLSTVAPCVAGPHRPQDRIPLDGVPGSLRSVLGGSAPQRNGANRPRQGDVVLAAITSCTNTSNPLLMLAAGLLARRARALGLSTKPWVKTSLSPGSRVVADYLASSGLQEDLDALGFHITGFGCMTCAGGSGPLDAHITAAIDQHDLTVAAVLSGNRNFEGRVNPKCKLAYLASPPLVVAYALAGTMDIDLSKDPLGRGPGEKPVMLADIWPDPATLEELARDHISPDLFLARYSEGVKGGPLWHSLEAQQGRVFSWQADSKMICRPPFLRNLEDSAPAVTDIRSARCLMMLGDSIATDHISPAGQISPDSCAAAYLREAGVAPSDFGYFMSWRGNHEVMTRGAFANIRIQNEMLPGRRGGFTRHWPSGEIIGVFDAARRYESENEPVIVIAGKEYGSGSSRDWAAKGTRLLGVRAVVVESMERIHRSNLIGMGVLPLQFLPGVTRHTLELQGDERFDLVGVEKSLLSGAPVTMRITRRDGSGAEVGLTCLLQTSCDRSWYRHGGVIPLILRSLSNARR